MPRVEFLVVGAGPTGLGAATRFTQAQAEDWLLIDSFPEAGGLARTDKTPEDFLFDIGGHVIFSHYNYFDRLLEESLGKFEDENVWKTHQRESYVRYKDTWVPYPFQNNLCRVPVEDQVKAIVGMVDAKVADAKEGAQRAPPQNFDEWIVRTMGEGLAELFMRPYNYKVWAIPPKLMQWGWLGERVAVVDANRAIANVLQSKEDLSWGPNAIFRFPCEGGTGAIWKAVANRLPQEKLLFKRELLSVDIEKREAIVMDHNTGVTDVYSYEKMISTMPLDLFIDRISSGIDVDIAHKAKAKLIHSSTHVIGIGLRGKNPHGSKCWLYFPESNCPFYRATVFSNYGPGNIPSASKNLPTLRKASGPSTNGLNVVPSPGPYWSLMLEVSENPDHKAVDSGTILEECIQGCINAGLLTPDDEIVSLYWKRFEHGYPTPSLERDEALKVLLPMLQAKGIYSRGRFGSYKYEIANQDHSLALGVETADAAMLGHDETTLHQPGYVNRQVGSQKNVKPTWETSKYEPIGRFTVAGDAFPTKISWLRGMSFPSVEDYLKSVLNHKN